ncbi:MAG TPA: PHP domain-containing protein, partial [Burkholderiales bacterium]|nr:PHP domain-containing protein [Burkholderiales bacterium]
MTSVPWGLIGPTVILDSHVHTRFSDGASEPLEVARAAAANGCGALAITDHGDTSVRAATPAYFDAIDAARLAFPDLIVFAGMEWNIPP